jgi:aldehyde:ferredoxin oxidoreductase
MPLNRKIAYIDLTTGDIRIEPIPLELRKKFLGGRGWMHICFTTIRRRGVIPWGRITP